MSQNETNRIQPRDEFLIKSKDEILSWFINDGKSILTAAKYVKHEIGNKLIGLSQVEYLLKKKSGDFQNEMEILSQTRQAIEDGINLLFDHYPVRIPLSKTIRQIVPGSFCSNAVSTGIYVNFPFLLFISFIQNISDNARSAFQKRNGCFDGFRISFRMEEKSLVIEDNAGGFDVSKITFGKSSTGGKGIFLAAFLNCTNHLGITCRIERIENGTRIIITFDNIEYEKTFSAVDRKSSQ